MEPDLRRIFQTVMSTVAELSMFHTEVEALTNVTGPILVKYIVSYSELEVLKDKFKDIKSVANDINHLIHTNEEFKLLNSSNFTVSSVTEPVFKPISGKIIYL